MYELPDLMAFIQQMRADCDCGNVPDWQTFAQRVRQWYTPERLQTIDDVVMGWQEMSSYASEQTLIHLTAALASVLYIPEYQALSSDDQNLALWIVLYHDVSKKAHTDKHDLTHAFRSAGICGNGLVRQGFVQDVDEQALDAWVKLTHDAKLFDETRDDDIPDNSKLGDIMAGIDKLFGGRDNPLGLIICGVLFHMSLNVVKEYPPSAPLTNEQICAYISPTLFPLLKVMMLTDSEAWSFFDADDRQIKREETLREFARVEQLLSQSRS